jgi:hypothetical protein
MLKDWGLGSVWLKTLVIGRIKLVFGNCKHVNFHRYRDFKKIVEDIDLSRIVGRMEGLSVDPATATS